MDEKVLVRGTMAKMNALSIILFVIGCGLLYAIINISQNVYISTNQQSEIFSFLVPAMLICFVLAGYFYFLFSKCEITVTNKRVYGKASFGKRVDLPLDMISAVGVSAFMGISVATASGRLTFYLCQNRDAVFDAISKLLMERQESKRTVPSIPVENTTSSSADELKKYKELLDSGVITQEEFEVKKKQLLGF